MKKNLYEMYPELDKLEDNEVGLATLKRCMEEAWAAIYTPRLGSDTHDLNQGSA